MYFVHSYYLQAKDPKIVAATTEYGVTIHASVEKKMFLHVSFTQRRVQKQGLRFLKISWRKGGKANVYKANYSLPGRT